MVELGAEAAGPPKLRAASLEAAVRPLVLDHVMSDVCQHAMLDACKRRDWQAVQDMLSEHSSLVNCTPGGRWSALMQACQAGHCEAVQMLLLFGADIGHRNPSAGSILDVAHPDSLPALQHLFEHRYDSVQPHRDVLRVCMASRNADALQQAISDAEAALYQFPELEAARMVHRSLLESSVPQSPRDSEFDMADVFDMASSTEPTAKRTTRSL